VRGVRTSSPPTAFAKLAGTSHIERRPADETAVLDDRIPTADVDTREAQGM
jgi:hypothetical protein